MSEEYRLSVGIDANGAAEGAATFKSATLEIQRSAEDAIDSVSKLEEGLRKVTTATDGTKVTEISRDLTSFSKAADEGAEKADDLGASVSRVGSSYGDAGERVQSASEQIKESTTTITDQLRSLNDFDASIRDIAEALASVGNISGAQGLTEMVDQFRMMYTSILEMRPELEATSQALSEMTNGSTSLTELTDSFIDFNKEALEARAELESGAISVEDYT